MCLPLIARVVAIKDDHAEVQLLEGEVVRANLALCPEVAVGQHVLLDRGLIMEVIADDQVETMLSFYAELTDLWAEHDQLVEEEARSA